VSMVFFNGMDRLALFGAYTVKPILRDKMAVMAQYSIIREPSEVCRMNWRQRYCLLFSEMNAKHF
jgi:hypothetical protein